MKEIKFSLNKNLKNTHHYGNIIIRMIYVFAGISLILLALIVANLEFQIHPIFGMLRPNK